MSYNVILTNDGEIDGFSLLNEKGIKTFHYPMIKILASNTDVFFSLDDYDFFIFTSKNGVNYFFDKQNIKSQDKSSIKVICIGSKTALEIQKYKIDPVFVAKRSYSNILFNELKDLIKGSKIIFEAKGGKKFPLREEKKSLDKEC